MPAVLDSLKDTNSQELSLLSLFDQFDVSLLNESINFFQKKYILLTPKFWMLLYLHNKICTMYKVAQHFELYLSNLIIKQYFHNKMFTSVWRNCYINLLNCVILNPDDLLSSVEHKGDVL